MEKLKKVYDVMVRDGHISDPEKNPFDKWSVAWSAPDKQEKLYDFLAENQYIKTKPKDQWLGEIFGGVTPEKKKPEQDGSVDAGVGLGMASPVTQTPETVNIADIPAGDPPAPGIDITMPQTQAQTTPQDNGLGQVNNQLQVSEPGTVDTKAVIGKQSEEVRAAKILETSKALDRLAVDHKMDPTPWKREIEAILTNKDRPQEVNDVLALRAAYSKFQELGVQRHTDLPGIGLVTSAVNAIGSGNGGEEMAKTWDLLSQAEQQLRNDNPNEWNKLIQSDREKHYGKLYAQDPKYTTKGDALLPGISVGEKQLIAGAIDNGWTGLSSESDLVGPSQDEIDAERARMNSEIGSGPLQELVLAHQTGGMKSNTSEVAEAKLRNELAHGQQKLAALKESGASPEMLAEANKAYSSIKKQADDMRATRHEELLQQIDQAKAALDRTDLPKMARAAGMELLKSLEEKEKGFIDPTYEFDKVMSENVEGIAEASEPTDTPLQAMRKYLANMIYEKKMLDERIGGGEGLFEGIKREATGLTVRGWNDDEKRSKELQQKIAAVSRVVLLNELPEHSTSAGSAFKGSFANTLYGASSMGKLFDTDTQQGQMIAVDEMLQAAGIDKEAAINPVYKKRFEEGKENPAWVSWEHLGSLGGMMTGMGMQSVAGGAVLEGVGAGKVLANLAAQVNAGTKGARFAKAALTAIKKGAEYEITGDIFKDQEHFFNFTTGFAGGAAEGVLGGIGRLGKDAIGKARQGMAVTGGLAAVYGKGTAKKMGQIVSNAFGNKSPEAAKWIMANGKSIQENLSGGFTRRVGHGIGAGVGQFAEGNIRTLQDIGGKGNVFGTIDGLVKIFEDSDVRAKYHEELNKQFGSTLSEKVGFFADMFFIGMMTGGGNKGIGNEARVRLRELYSEMTTEQRSLADELVNSAGELDQMHDSVLDSQGRTDESPTEVEKLRNTERDLMDRIDKENLSVEEAADVQNQVEEVRAKIAGIEGVEPTLEAEPVEPTMEDTESPVIELGVEPISVKEEGGGQESSKPELVDTPGDLVITEADPYERTTPEEQQEIIQRFEDLRNGKVTRADGTVVVGRNGISSEGLSKVTDSEWAHGGGRRDNGPGNLGALRNILSGEPFKGDFGKIERNGEKGSATGKPWDGNFWIVSDESSPLDKNGAIDKSKVSIVLNAGLSPFAERLSKEFPGTEFIDFEGNKFKEGKAPESEPFVEPTELNTIPGDKSTTSQEPLNVDSNTPPTPPVTNEAAGGGTPPEPPVIEPTETPNEKKLREENEQLKAQAEADKKKAAEDKIKEEAKRKQDEFDKATGVAKTVLTLQKYSETNSKATNKVLDNMDNTYKKTTHAEQYSKAMSELTGGTSETVNGKTTYKRGTENPLLKAHELTLDKIRSIDQFSDVLAKRLVMFDIIGHYADSLAEMVRGETDPIKKAEMETLQLDIQKINNELAEVLKNQGTIGGQGISFIGFWRNMYIHADGHISMAIKEHNSTLAAKEKLRSERIADGINEVKERVGADVVDAVVSSMTDTPKGGTAKGTAKRERAKRKESIEKLKNLLKLPDAKAMDVTTLAAELIGRGGEAAIELTKIGISLAKEGAVRFVDWAKSMRKETDGMVSFEDADLEKLFKMEHEGNSAEKLSELALKKASIAPEKKAAREKTLRQQIQDELKATNEAKDLQERLEKNVGLTKTEAALVMKEGKDVIENTAKKVDDRNTAIKEKEIERSEKEQQAYIDKMADKVAESRKREVAQKVSRATEKWADKQGGADLRQILLDEGLSENEANDVMATQGAELAAKGLEALKKAGKATEAKPPKTGEKTLRQRVQDAFNFHFSMENGENISLKERLMRQDTGLTEEQADIILKEEAKQLAEREQKLIDKVLAKDAENAQKDFEKQQKEDQKDIKRNTREALTEHFGRDTIQKKLIEDGMDADTAKKVAAIARKGLSGGKTLTPELMAKEIKEVTNLTDAEIDAAVELITTENGKTMFDRVKEKTGLPDADVQAIVDNASAEFKKRAAAQVAAQVKKFKAKRVTGRAKTRPLNDVDRALETLANGEFSDADVNSVFSDRLGFIRDLTPDEVAEARKLGAQLAKTRQGGVLEHDAARNLDRFFDQFIPKDKGGQEVLDTWKAMYYAGMLSGMATSVKNVLSAATITVFSPAQNIFNYSEWMRAGRESIKADKGKKGEVFMRMNPITGAAVKYRAMSRGVGSARRLAADIWLEGFMGTKFAELGDTKLGRQMNILERRYAESWKDTKWRSKLPWVYKYAGRALQAQDVFLRTIGHEMQLADAFRRENVNASKDEMKQYGFDADKKNYAAWVNFNMSISKHPNYSNALEAAKVEVAEHQAALGSKGTPKQTSRFVSLRTRELLIDGFEHNGVKFEPLKVSEKGKEDAEAIAKSQIFTLQRYGVASGVAAVVNKLKGMNKVTDILMSPIVPFTTIIGNMADTIGDYNPITGVPRSMNFSLSELINYATGKKNDGTPKWGSAAMGNTNPEKNWFMARLDMAAKDQRYYEQIGRAWTGINTLITMGLLTSGNPTKGLAITWDADDDSKTDTGNEYSVLWNGNKLFSYKELPVMAAPLAFIGALHSFARNPERFGGKKDMAARIAYAWMAMETLPMKMSVAESSLNFFEMLGKLYDSGTDPSKSSADKVYNSIVKPYLNTMTKALPQRTGMVEQFMGLFNTDRYSNQTFWESLEYFGEGAAYGSINNWLGGPEHYKALDNFGDEIPRSALAEALPMGHSLLELYKEDVSKRPYRRFLQERDIVLGNAQNREVPWVDDNEVLGIAYKDYTPEQWNYFKKESGTLFKGAIEELMKDPYLSEYDKELVTYYGKQISLTEKMVLKALSSSRSEARGMVQEKYGKESSYDNVERTEEYSGGNMYDGKPIMGTIW